MVFKPQYKNKYLIQRVKSSLKSLFLSILDTFIIKKKKRILFSSEFNVNFSQNSKPLFLYFLSEYPEYECKFLIDDTRYLEELKMEYGDHFISLNNMRGIYFVLSAYSWITSSLQTPLLFAGIRKRVVIHLGHGSPIKSIGAQESESSLLKLIYYTIASRNFTHIFSASPIFDRPWSRMLPNSKAKIIRSPQARNDYIRNDDKFPGFDSKMHNILYAPTWRPYENESSSFLCEIDFEKLNKHFNSCGINLYIRSHPNFEVSCKVILSKYSNIKCLTSNDVANINEVISLFDLLITDYSSIYVDYLLTLKPILFYTYDLDLYAKTVGFSIDYEAKTPGPLVKNTDELITELRRLMNDSNYFLSARLAANDEMNTYKSSHRKESSNKIIEIINGKH